MKDSVGTNCFFLCALAIACLCYTTQAAGENTQTGVLEKLIAVIRDPFVPVLPSQIVATPAPQSTPTPSSKPTPAKSPVPSATPIRPGQPAIPLPTASGTDGRPTPGKSAAPDGSTEKPAPALTLTGIIFNTIKPQAIINGTVVSIGDSIDGVEVKGIQKGIVELKYKDTLIKLNMDQIKSPSDSKRSLSVPARP